MNAEKILTKYKIEDILELMNKPGNEPLKEFIDALWDDRNGVIADYLKQKDDFIQNRHIRKQKAPTPE